MRARIKRIKQYRKAHENRYRPVRMTGWDADFIKAARYSGKVVLGYMGVPKAYIA